MNMVESLNRFVEAASAETMLEAAHRLVELLEADEVEPLKSPGRAASAEDVAERLEDRLEKVRRRRDSAEGLELLEDAIASLRAADGVKVEPWTYEDSDGVRWFVLADEDNDVVACYTSAPFIEADV